MNNGLIDAHWQKSVLLWLGILGCQLCFFLLIYIQVADMFPIDVMKPILPTANGEFWLVSILAFLSAISLFEAFFYRQKLVRRAIEQKSLEVIRYALVKCLTLATSVALWGVFLAFTIHYQYFFIFLVVAFVATLLQYPQKNDIENAAPDFEAHTRG
jgi:hypothetical protein